jgi:hypothetical protein
VLCLLDMCCVFYKVERLNCWPTAKFWRLEFVTCIKYGSIYVVNRSLTISNIIF